MTTEAVESPAPRPVALTDREHQVLFLASFGRKNGEIGRAMFVSEDTVKTHFRHLMKKLRARDRTHATRIALEMGLLTLRPLVRADEDGRPVPVVARVAADWQQQEMARQDATPRPMVVRHIAACYAAESCPCREGSTWEWRPVDPAAVKP